MIRVTTERHRGPRVEIPGGHIVPTSRRVVVAWKERGLASLHHPHSVEVTRDSISTSHRIRDVQLLARTAAAGVLLAALIKGRRRK
jgi:hypothetical protein